MGLRETVRCQVVVMSIADVGTGSAFVQRRWLQRDASTNILHRLIDNSLSDTTGASSSALLLIVVQCCVHAALLARPHHVTGAVLATTIVVLSFLGL